MSNVRVRFAPSPTGHLHVGGARTAIYNWLFARHHGGTFIIRVEDTDQARSTRESEEMVLSDLRWLGLTWDEGPDNGGPHAPYRQSERMQLYAQTAKLLLVSRHAYRCFCTEEELEAKRQLAESEGRPPHYDLTCFHLSNEVSEQRAGNGDKFVVRFHVPKEEGAGFDADVRIDDLIRGAVEWKKESLGDFILLRSDGMPTYNFCVVVDDHDMEITHVIRAEEHLTNTHRQVLIYRAMQWPEPQFAHISLILGQDRSKLSKRHGATSVSAYAEEGYLPDAMLNYLTLLGWSKPDGHEIFTREEAAADFTLDRVHAAPAVFDPHKLLWMNGQYLNRLSTTELAQMVRPLLEKEGWMKGDDDATSGWLGDAVELIRKGMHRPQDAPEALRFFFEHDTEAVLTDSERREVLQEEGVLALLDALAEDLRQHGTPLDADAYQAMAERLKSSTGLKGKKLFMPMRIALTGSMHGPELNRAIPLMERGSKIETLNRIEAPLRRVELLREILEQSWI
jgi:glutamyl-tRNA synthetase